MASTDKQINKLSRQQNRLLEDFLFALRSDIPGLTYEKLCKLATTSLKMTVTPRNVSSAIKVMGLPFPKRVGFKGTGRMRYHHAVILGICRTLEKVVEREELDEAVCDYLAQARQLEKEGRNGEQV